MFPEIRLSDSFVIPSYLLYLSILYSLLVVYAVRRADRFELSRSTTLDFSLLLMVGGFLGARLTHVFYELPHYYAEDWTRTLKFWEGGFVFYGGFLGGLAFCWLYQRFQKLPFWTWADFFAPILALGYGLGRGSCFLAGCCYGKACDFPWAVVFPWDYHQTRRHPTQLYAVIWELTVYALLLFLERKRGLKQRSGSLFMTWLALHSVGRLLMEHYRDDFRGDALLGISISSWFSLLLLSISISWLLINRPKNSQPELDSRS